MKEYTETAFLNDLIKQMGIGINISRIYPKGHPSLKPIVKRVKILLREAPIEQESISLVIVEDVIMIGEERFDSKRLPVVKSLVQRFHQLEIKSITFSVELSEGDVKEFFTAMAATRADIEDYGGIASLLKTKGVVGIIINKFHVGVMSTDGPGQSISWDQFLGSLTVAQTTMTEEDRMKELSNFLGHVGVHSDEPAEVQTGKIVGGLEKLALMVADQYGEDRWDEYSVVFSRMLSVLSPTIKKNVAKYSTENKKLAVLFKNLVPTMTDEDIVDMISMKAKEKSPTTESEVVDILKNVTGSRLPGILSTLRVSAPELDFEKIVGRLMGELRTTKGDKVAEKFLSKNLENEMRLIFPRLRDRSHEERIRAVDALLELSEKLFESEKYNLVRLLIDRFDTMADAETKQTTFVRVIDALKSLFLKSQELQKEDIVQFVSKKFGKHLLRREASLSDRKKAVIKTICEIKDENYVPELVSLLWDQGTFAEAGEALIALSEFSIPVLIETLMATDDRSVRMKIIDVLVRVGDKAEPEFRKLLRAPEWYVRRNGVFLLGEMKASAAVDDIVRLINDDAEQIQIAVIEALNKIGGDKVRDTVLKGLNSEHRRVIVAAMKVLPKEDIEEKVAEVVQWLKVRKAIPDPEEEQFRCEIIDVASRFSDDSIIDTLITLLDEKPLFKAQLLQPTKKVALNALAKIGNEKAMQALKDAANHKDEFVVSVAQGILGKIKSGK